MVSTDLEIGKQIGSRSG